MPPFPIRLIDERTDKKALPKEALRASWYRSLTLNMRRCVPEAHGIRLAIVYVDRAHMRVLNKQYRNIDRVTDVLSYGYANQEGALEEGEIVICPDVALKQRQRFRTSTQQELARLFFHGLLHIYGYDHTRPSERRVMRALETSLMKNL